MSSKIVMDPMKSKVALMQNSCASVSKKVLKLISILNAEHKHKKELVNETFHIM